MARSTRKLDSLAARLEQEGADPARIGVVRRAQSFRRSWLELAKALSELRDSGRYAKWGFEDFQTYCQQELTLKRGTVDKLVMSYGTLRRHAPQVLEWDGVQKTIPSYQAIDYFQRAMGPEETEQSPANEAPKRKGVAPVPATAELKQELSRAVFEEGQSVAELRKRFDGQIFPQPKAATELQAIKRARSAAQKLIDVLPEIKGVPQDDRAKLEKQLGRFKGMLQELVEPTKAKVERARARADRRARKRTGS